MAKAKLTEQEKLQQEKVEERVSAVEKFFNENKKIIWGTLGALVVIGLLILAWQRFIMEPKKAEAREQMFPAEAAFRAGNYEIALNGDGNALGFADIVKEYGSKAGKAVYMYEGICQYMTGNYEAALASLKKYTGKDPILAARALACQGDALVALEKYAEAVPYFEKAAARADDMFAATYLLKAGVTCEELGQDEKALGFYKKIKDQYPQSVEGYDIDKYITRIENKPAK